MVLFAEGGGGRPGDTDMPIVAGLHVTTLRELRAALAARCRWWASPPGRCFAGNAALLGCCDLIIATRDSNIGMGGPAMVEGGGLGRFRPEDIGPAAVQSANGVIDVLVDDEAAAVAAAKQYLGYFQRAARTARPPDPLALRDVLPENRVRSYDMRAGDRGAGRHAAALLELRAGFGVGIHTALARMEGRPVGAARQQPAAPGRRDRRRRGRQGGALHAAVQCASACRWCR